MAKKKSGESLKQKVYKQLRSDIVFGRVLPGEHLKEASLTAKFRCSRGPVREAFNQLSSEGFIELLQNQGAVVRRTSPEEIADYYAMLELLEGQAVEWAEAPPVPLGPDAECGPGRYLAHQRPILAPAVCWFETAVRRRPRHARWSGRPRPSPARFLRSRRVRTVRRPSPLLAQTKSPDRRGPFAATVLFVRRHELARRRQPPH